MFGRVILNVLGTFFLLLGVLGLALPLLPATPFLLLASACYVRGSKTLHQWLMNNRYLGTYIKNIRDKRGMPMRAKVITIVVLWASLLLSIYRLESLLLDITLVLVGVGVTTLIFKLETVQQH
ncbi:MAG TPA: YbaN family protein [Pyrinomonadaceae bacterium]|nr:YbaN family protein [Pyrinomonadaceae bacterium]